MRKKNFQSNKKLFLQYFLFQVIDYKPAPLPASLPRIPHNEITSNG